MNIQRISAVVAIVLSFVFVACAAETESVEPVDYKCPCTIGTVYTCHCAERDGDDPTVQTGERICDLHQHLTLCYCGAR